MGVFQGSCCNSVRNSIAEGLLKELTVTGQGEVDSDRECRFSLDFRKKFFTAITMRNQHRLLREAVDAPALGKCSKQGWLEL